MGIKVESIGRVINRLPTYRPARARARSRIGRDLLRATRRDDSVYSRR